MSKEKKCPECGERIEADECFCQNCGAKVLVEETPNESNVADTPIVGAGARANIMGGIHQTSTTHTNTNVNTSNVDNSSTVNHNTTYVMNEKKKEFCEVCGNPLEDKHARCPKCGKEICLDCKVKGKTRCIECEKKAMNEYRVAFQQLLLTTNGNIGVAGRQMMDQKARELDLEDVKISIEKELTEIYKPSNRAVQPEVVPLVATIGTTEEQVTESAKGIGTLDGRMPIKPKNTNSGSKIWILLVAILVVVIAVFLILNKTEETSITIENVQQEELSEQSGNASLPVKQQPQETVIVEQPRIVEQPVVVEKTDSNYDIGMKAYESGKGLEAVSAFKKSGSAKAYYMLGVIYENGCGNVGKNAMMARKNFKKAADMGHEEAKSKL